MTVEILLILAGLALVVFGSNILVDGASDLARRLGVSEFIIGLTVVGFGTSLPELVVSLEGAIRGSSDIAIGNVVGSNIFNTLFILGLSAVLAPIPVTPSNKRWDIPAMIAVTLFFVLICLKGTINRVDGVVFLLIFAAFMWMSFRLGKADAAFMESDSHKLTSLPISILMIVGGLAGLVFGGDLFVDNAVKFSREVGVSEKFIAITLLACGTSLPEFVTSLVAIAKKKGQLALGNIIGSNVFNILLILGVSSLVRPLTTSSMTAVDLSVLALSALLMLFAYIGRGNKLSRTEGAIMVAVFAGYMAWMSVQQ